MVLGAGLAAAKRQAPVGRGPADRMDTAASGLKGTHPGRISLVWNVETPLGSGWSYRPVG